LVFITDKHVISTKGHQPSSSGRPAAAFSPLVSATETADLRQVWWPTYVAIIR
jgi:hypothetical protein